MWKVWNCYCYIALEYVYYSFIYFVALFLIDNKMEIPRCGGSKWTRPTARTECLCFVPLFQCVCCGPFTSAGSLIGCWSFHRGGESENRFELTKCEAGKRLLSICFLFDVTGFMLFVDTRKLLTFITSRKVLLQIHKCETGSLKRTYTDNGVAGEILFSS